MQRTVLIKPSQIRAIRLQCECGREIIQPVRTGSTPMKVLDECPFCGANWQFHGPGDPVTAQVNLKRLLEETEQPPAEAQGVTIALEFEIEI